MRLAPEITAKLIFEATDKEDPYSAILLNGMPIGVFVLGEYLEAALAWHDCFVVLLSDNCFAEAIYIHLLDAKGNLIDSAVIGTILSLGNFRSFQITGSDQFSFSFFADDQFQVTLLSRPRFRGFWPAAFGLLRGFMYLRVGWWRHFSIRRQVFVAEKTKDGMRLAPEITAELLVKGRAGKASYSAILLNGSAIGASVKGERLVTALAWGDFFVVLFADTCAFATRIYVHFLDSKGRLLDSAIIGAFSSEGNFRSLQITGLNQFSFRFHAEDIWHIELFSELRLRWPLPWSKSRLAWRGFRLWHHFDVRQQTR